MKKEILTFVLMILLVSCVSAVANTGSWASPNLKLGAWEEVFNGTEGNPGAIINAHGNNGEWNLTNFVSGIPTEIYAGIYKTPYTLGNFKIIASTELWGSAINRNPSSATVISDDEKSILYFSVPYAGHTLVVLGKVTETDRDSPLTKHWGNVELTRMYIFDSDELFVDRLFEDAIYSEFLADNPEFHFTIQGAIDAASSGDTIHVAAGTYNYESEGSPVPAGLIKVTKPLTIKAADGTRPIIDGSGFDGVFKIHPSALTNGDTVIIEGFEIKGNEATSIAITMQGCFETNPAKVIIRDNWFHGMAGGIDFWGATSNLPAGWISTVTNVEITDNKFYNMVTSGTDPGFGVMIEDTANWATAGGDYAVKIENNEFSNLPSSGSNPGFGIAIPRANDIWEAANAYIANNDFASVSMGVAITDGDVTDTIITKNNFNPTVTFGLYHLGTGTLDARENYWGDCTGPDFGVYNSGSGNSIVNTTAGKVLFNPWIGVCIENKTSTNCAYELNDVRLNADVVSLEDIDSVWFSYTINEINYNKTANHYSGNNYSILIPSSELVGGQDLKWNVYANDTYGFNYSNGWQELYIIKSTYLEVEPFPANGINGWWITPPVFTLFTDSEVTGLITYYRWDDETFVYSGPFGLEHITNYYLGKSPGVINLKWWSNLTCINESGLNQTLKIDLANPTITNLQPEDGTTVFGDLTPTISALLKEKEQSNSGINLSSIIMNLDGDKVALLVIPSGENDAIVTYTPTETLSEGNHEIYIYVKDNAGRPSEKTWSFQIDETIPSFIMNIYSPKDEIYTSKKIPFNISLSQEVDKIEYINYNDRFPKWRNLCLNCEEYGYSKNRTKLLNEGKNMIEIRSSNYLGQTEEKEIGFFVDSKNPKILKTNPKTGFTNGEFSVDFIEENPKSLQITYGNNNNGFEIHEFDIEEECSIDERSRKYHCDAQIDLFEYNAEEIIYWANLTDITNERIDSRRFIRLIVDTNPPVLKINSPNDGSIYERRIDFKLSVSEKSTIEFIDNSKSNPRWQRLCINCDSYGIERLMSKSFTVGNHNLVIKATDKAGNSDSEEIDFEVIA